MNTKFSFLVTLVISIIIQVIATIVESYALLAKIPVEFMLLRQLLIVEVLVEFIQAIFYLWLAYNFNTLTDVTQYRYIDWTITTPIMLITLIFYLIYSRHREKGNTASLEFFTMLSDNSTMITSIVYLNWLMLIFGFLAEKKILPTCLGVMLGFIPFVIYYFLIYINYAIFTKTGVLLFWYFFFFWSLYGIVAFLPYYMKNTLYNILDLFAKNFFGLFLSYIILTENY